MNKQTLQFKIELFRRELKDLESISVSCHTCESYSMPECLRYESSPPPDVVKHGCDEWVHDPIPF